MCQIIGGMMVVFSSFLFGFQKVSLLKRKLFNLKQIASAIFLLRNEFSFSARELWEASSLLSGKVLGDVGKLFFEVSKILSNDETLSFSAAWERAQAGKEQFFSNQTQNFLKDFIRPIGTLSRELEEAHLEKSLSILQNLQKEEEAKYKKDRKLILSLSGVFGVTVFILLI